jgi:hypothetical protein
VLVVEPVVEVVVVVAPAVAAGLPVVSAGGEGGGRRSMSGVLAIGRERLRGSAGVRVGGFS